MPRHLSLQFISLLLLALITISPVAAQTTMPGKVSWGPPYKEPGNTLATGVISIVPEGFYVLRQRVAQNTNARPRAWVEFYSRDMKLQRSEEMELKYKGKQREFENVIMLGGKLYLLTSFHNTAKKRNYLFRQEISQKTLLPSKNLEMICESEARNAAAKGKFRFHTSGDSTRLLIYTELPYEKKSPERFGFRVFDENFNLVWEKNIVLPFPDNQFTVEEYRVDDQGNVFLLGVLYEDEAKWRRRGNPTYKYVILSYLDNGSEAREFRIEPENKFITDLTFRPAKNGNLVCAGFYSERGNYSIKGATYFRLDTRSREFSDWNYQPFSLDFLTENMSDKKKQKAIEAAANNDVQREVELYDYSLDELILRSDGGAVLVAEQYYVEQDFYRDYPMYGYYPYGFYDPFLYSRYGRTRTDYYYHYNDIMVVNLRPSGEIEWAARVPKRQETRNDGGYNSSYAMAIVRDKLFFVFNDSARNFAGGERSKRLSTYSGGDGVLTLAQVGKDGSVAAFPLALNSDAGILTRPKMCKQISRKTMAILGERNREYRFANLEFE
jgi:hypothetical protein